MNTNEKTPFTIYCNKLHSVLRKSALFIEPNNDSNIDSQLRNFLNEHFKYGEYARPTIEIGETSTVIAVPNKERLFDLCYSLRKLGFNELNTSYWKGNYEDYLISKRKYLYMEWCQYNNDYEKLFIYLIQEYIKKPIKTAINIYPDTIIAIPMNCIENTGILLIHKLKELYHYDEIKYIVWNGDDDSYYNALKKYSYIEKCVKNQNWKKLKQYIDKEIVNRYRSYGNRKSFFRSLINKFSVA
ncbi:MAG: hypothetical protein IJV56_08565 [Neisseriaceae bacterium]|nr:hypothetical protein [Neisseriaceae bacterium]